MVTTSRARRLARALVRLRTDPAPRTGPLVSIVVTNRDGEEHLRRLLDGLRERTNYRPIELVLVDNGSSDGSVALVRDWSGPTTVLANATNQSFSAGNNQGVRAATGDLVLLANNDIDPIHPDWLGFMVASLRDGVAAVGAMLVYPNRPPQNHPPAHPDLTTQHLGTHFAMSKWGVRAVNAGTGDDPLAVGRPRVRRVPAVTAACLLARRTDLLATPLDEAYWYGSEDWDLCVRLDQLGDVVIDERAVLFHHEFGTQDKYRSPEWLQRRTDNHQWFNALWGPAVLRSMRDELTTEPADWFLRGGTAPTLHVTPRRSGRGAVLARRLTAEARAAGWTVEEGAPRGCDVAVAFSAPDDVQWFGNQNASVAVVADDVGSWVDGGALDAATHVVVADELLRARLDVAWGAGVARVHDLATDGSGSLLAAVEDLVRPDPTTMRVGIATCAPDWRRAQFWGDTHLARGLARAFRRQGHEATELIVPDWRGIAATSCNVVVHLRGLRRRPTARGQYNVLWVISHPDRLEPGECDDYDVIASASRLHADQLSASLGRPVHFMPQATDADTFTTGQISTEHEADVLYVGNARWPHRRAPRWMVRNGRSFHLYGKNWHDFPEGRLVRAEYIPNRELPRAYRSAGVVVADHHGSMRRNGFVANRLFDVLASGGVVLSDDVAGIDEVFGDIVPTYGDAAELEARVRWLLDDDDARRRVAREGRRVVVEGHTLDHRARSILRWVDEL